MSNAAKFDPNYYETWKRYCEESLDALNKFRQDPANEETVKQVANITTQMNYYGPSLRKSVRTIRDESKKTNPTTTTPDTQEAPPVETATDNVSLT